MASKLKLYEVQPFHSIKEMLQLAREQDGEKPAFQFLEKDTLHSITYREFQDLTFYLGTGLCSLDVNHTHMAIIGENSFPWILTYLTILKSDGVCVPVDKELPLEDIAHVLGHSDSQVLFYSAKYEPRLRKNRDLFPNIRWFIGFDRKEDDGEFLSFQQLIEKGKVAWQAGNHEYDSLSRDENELALLVYTSGTTGMAKGVMLSEHNLVSCVYYGLMVSAVRQKGLSVLPYHHTYEAVAGILVAIHYHSTLCIISSLKKVLKGMEYYHPDYMYIVPAFAEMFYSRIWSQAKSTGKEKALLTLIGFSRFLRKFGIDLRRKLFSSIHTVFGGNMRKLVCGGAPLRKEIGDFFDDIGIDLINGYGITECSPLVAANREELNAPATAGFPLPCCQIRFDDLLPDGTGEICVKGDTVMLGYYKDPALSSEVLIDGWFHTGDYGMLDELGRLIITGRKKNLIVLNNGKNIFPEELEARIQQLPYVKDVVVYGISDASGVIESLCAEMFPDAEQLPCPAEELHERFRNDVSDLLSDLPIYKRIHNVVIRNEEFEKTTTNKIKRASVLAGKQPQQ